MIHHLQDEEPGKLVVKFSLSEVLRIRGAHDADPNPRTKEDKKNTSQLNRQKKKKKVGEQIYPSSAFCFIHTLNWLNDAHPILGEESALHSLQIQMLLSSKISITDTHKIALDQTPGNPVVQSGQHKINHHIWDQARFQDFVHRNSSVCNAFSTLLNFFTSTPISHHRYPWEYLTIL